MKKKYYAVKNNGFVFMSWDECKKYVSGKPVQYKGFATLEECEEYTLTHTCKIINKATPAIVKGCSMTDKINKKLKGKQFASGLERSVAFWLTARNIKYKMQEDTLKCINPNTGKLLPYDFELPKYKIIIEVQGYQHYDAGIDYNKTSGELKYQTEKDEYKKQYAIDNGYQFVTITYKDIERKEFGKIIESKINKCVDSTLAR